MKVPIFVTICTQFGTKNLVQPSFRTFVPGFSKNLGLRHLYQGYQVPQVPRFSTSLSMGDVESALFSDAVINFIYHKLEERGVFNNFKFAESYRDDGIVISNHLMNLEEVNQWKLLRGLPGKRKNRLFLALSPFLGRKICQDGQKIFFF